MNKLPEKLVQLRKHYGYSQQAVAEKVNVTVIEYMGWENGREMPDLDHLILLSECFEISLDEMMINEVPDLPEKTAEEACEQTLNIPFQKEVQIGRAHV